MTRIEALRTAMKLSRSEMAERILLDRSQVLRMEQGQPEKGPLSLLLDRFAVDIGRDDLTAAAFTGAAEAAE